MTQSWTALFRSVEYSYFCLGGFGSYVPAASVSPPQTVISQKKQRKEGMGGFPSLVNWSWRKRRWGASPFHSCSTCWRTSGKWVQGVPLSPFSGLLLSRLSFLIYIGFLCVNMYQHLWAFRDKISLWCHTLLVKICGFICENLFTILSVGQKIGISNEIAQMTYTELSGSRFPPRIAQNNLVRQSLKKRLKPRSLTNCTSPQKLQVSRSCRSRRGRGKWNAPYFFTCLLVRKLFFLVQWLRRHKKDKSLWQYHNNLAWSCNTSFFH